MPVRSGYKSPLAEIDFEHASDVVKYADTLRKIGRAEQLELHTAADELESVLVNSALGRWERFKAKQAAKKVTRHLRKSADHARGMAVAGVALGRAFRQEYSELLEPQKKQGPKGRVLDWTS